MLDKIFQFFQWAKGVYEGSKALQAIYTTFQVVTAVMGVKGFMQARQMLAKGQSILANKTSAGGKIPVVYGVRRVGAQIIYMDVNNNDSRHLFVVYALSVGECDEILYRTIELDGNPLTDPNRFKYGCYVGSDRNNQTGYNNHQPLNTVSQVGSTTSAGAGQFGTNQNARYRITLNLHHGTPSQTADPMLVASMPNWTSSHKLNGVCYIAAHYKYDKEGMFSGIPQLTVQVKGKRVYDPRSGETAFTDSTGKVIGDNPALCFLDYITNNEYGKGLTTSQINMTTFGAAANVCDTPVDQPYFNGTAQSLTWSANSGDNFFTIAGADANEDWWQNKIGELLDLFDANGNGVIDGDEIVDVQRSQFFDSTAEYIVFINNYFGSSYASQTGSSLLKVKRFTCNGYLDTNKNVMDNAKELLANMRGIFLYIDGKYELSIEDTGSSTFSITDNHIISDAGISVDYGNKDKKANKVIVEFFNANKRYELDTATVLHDATPEYYSDDNDEILEIKAEFPYITDPYIAYNMGKAILTRSRKQMTIQFLGTPEMYKLNVGDIVTLSYAGTFDETKTCRVEALELQPNGLVAVSLIEYFDVYTWQSPPEEPLEELANLPSAYAVKAPTNITFTDTDSSSTGRPFLSWDEPTDFPDYQYRVNVVDNSGNQVINRIVDVENCDLNFVPTGSYVANITSLNTLGTESSPARFPASGTFTIGDAPTATADIQDDAIVTNKILDGNVTDAKINSITANKITAGTIDASVITVTNLDADNITSGTVATARLNVNDIISTGSIIVSGDNISDLTNDSAFINGGQVNSNVTSISGGVITTGTVNTARLNVLDIISTGNIIVTGDNVSDLTNDASYVDASGAASAAPVQSVAGATGAVSASTIITAGNIVVQGDNISTLTNNENFIDGTQVNSNVTSISGGAITTGTVAAARIDVSGVITAGSIIVSGDNISTLTNDESFIDGTQVNSNVTSISGNVITTGTINASVVNVTNINADNVSTGTLNANRIQIDNVTIDTDGSGNLIIKSDGVGTTQIADNAVTNDKVNSISATKITADQLDSARINVDTLNVKSFDNVSSTIVSHVTAGTKFPLARDGQAYVQRTSPYTGSNASFVPVTITQVRDNAGYVAIFSGVLGDVSGGRVQYSLNNSTWVNANGNTNISWSAGTYRGYTYVYTGQITTLSTSQSTVYWRVYFSGAYNHTQLSLNVMMDNTR